MTFDPTISWGSVLMVLTMIATLFMFWWKISAMVSKWEFRMGLMWTEYCRKHGLNKSGQLDDKPTSTKV